MNKFYETANHLKREIERKERELQELKQKLHGSEVREFYWFIQDQVSAEMTADFLNSSWVISFMGKTVKLYNCAETFSGIEDLLTNYMDDDEIEYKRGENQ